MIQMDWPLFLALAKKYAGGSDVKSQIAHTTFYETSDSTATVRKIEIPGVASLNDIEGVVLNIRSNNLGSTGTTTLQINTLEPKPLYYPVYNSSNTSNTGAYYGWVRGSGDIYQVVWFNG